MSPLASGHHGEDSDQDGVEPKRRRLIAIASLFMGTLLLMMDSSIANVGLPTIAHELHAPASDAVLIVAAYNLVLAMTLMPFAALGMLIGFRRLFLTGLCVYLAGAAFSWFAHSLMVLLLARAVQALGAAAALSVGSALVRATYPRHQLGRGLGLNTLAAASGGAIAPIIGGMIVSHASWHWVFVAGAPIALATLITGRALPDPDSVAHKFDMAGAVLCAATFGLLISGLRFLTAVHAPAIPVALLVAGGVIGFLLVRYEMSQTHPVLPVDLLKRPAVALSVAAALCCYLASTSVMLALPFRLHSAGFSPAEIGAVIVPYALTAAFFAPASGMLSDHVSPTILGTAGLGVAAIALLLLAHLPAMPTHMDIIIPMALCGVGFGSFMSPNARLIIGSVDAGRAASASSLISTTRMMGQAVGSTFVVALLALGLWPAAPLIATGLVVMACGFSLARRWVAAPE
jgi:DHA2 family multidrug resistance protein-like MFS transporter